MKKILFALVALLLFSLEANATVLCDRARMTTATSGTGTITLGSAVSGYLTFAQCGILDGQTVRYCIDDPGATWPPTAFEVAQGVYTSAGTTLTRGTIYKSSNSNNPINLSGTAHVFVCGLTQDLRRYEPLLHSNAGGL